MAGNTKLAGRIGIDVVVDNSKYNKSINKMKKSTDGFAKKMKSLKGVMAGVFAGVSFAFIAKGIADASMEFESGMKRVKALSGATKDEFQDLSKAAKELGISTIYSASQVSEGMQKLAMAGYKTNQIINAMPGLLNAAAAGQVELGITSDITSNILSAYGMEAKETTKIADILTKTFTTSNTTLEELGEVMVPVAPVAKSAGIALEELAAAAGLLGNSGIKGSLAGTALRNIILRLINPPKETADALNQLGISIVDSSGKMKSLTKIIGLVREKTKGMTDIERLATASKIAGVRASSSFIKLLELGKDKLRDYTKELKNSGGTAEKIAKEQNEGLKGSLKELKSAYEGLSISLGEIFSPSVEQTIDVIAEAIRKTATFIEKIKLLHADIEGLGYSALKSKQRVLIDSIAEYQSKFGKYNTDTGDFDMSGFKNYLGKNYSPALAKVYEGFLKDLKNVSKKLKEIGPPKEAGLVTSNGNVEVLPGLAGGSEAGQKKRIKRETTALELALKERLALSNYNALTEKQMRYETEIKKLELLKEGTEAHLKQYVTVLEAFKAINTEMGNIREDALGKELEYAKAVVDAQKEAAEQMQEAWRRGFDRIMDHTLSWKEKMVAAIQEVLFYLAKQQVISQLTPLKSAGGFKGMLAQAGLALAGSFASGGIIPGNFSQPVPVMAHGSEMVLNPSQQADLFKMLNGQGGKQSAQAPVFINAPQINTGASAQDVFSALEKNARQFAMFVGDRINNDPYLHNVVRNT